MLLPEMLCDNDYITEFKKGITTVISVISEKIQNSKNRNLSRNDKIMAIGPCTSSDDLKGKIALIMQFLDVAST